MKAIIFVFLLTLFTSFNCSSTAQIPDYITIDDKEYRLHTNPLDKHLITIKWEMPENLSTSSANWRGYVASWKIDAGLMFLTDVTISIYHKDEKRRESKSIFHEIFPGRDSINAVWYSGSLVIPHGEMTHYVHMGYGSSYEYYIVIRISEGVVTDYQDFTAAEFDKYKEAKFQTFKETQEFQKQLEELTSGEYNWSEEDALFFLQNFHAEYYLSL
ncbi:hypothetical protein [Alishewanella jeotgali]|uniref:Lipoprotein n=1 Tax=Alishewanella jeotgali KCTC 22429 TaxID=1129374 RepID=H3ZJ81_9ALTE|nr:hypothetical protein [Alishewanella jeotgali]EHR39369.1 hypothetical protein AJE_17235 [Alishewanella jeotgali KCTC 22429]